VVVFNAKMKKNSPISWQEQVKSEEMTMMEALLDQSA